MRNKLVLLATVYSVISVVKSVGLSDHPSQSDHPGHLLPFGDVAAGRRVALDEATTFPSPINFVQNFVLSSRPLLLRGVFESAPAFTLWEDDYFRSLHEPVGSHVNVETRKKEDRTQGMLQETFKSFVDMYGKQPVYMVSPVPQYLQRDVPIVASLQCPALVRLFRQNVMWMSSGGTKSVVHIDGLENFNCLIRGVKEMILVDRKKYPNGVPLDKAGGTFSTLDVDAVDYVKYPSMKEVGEYYYANMTAGDCLYIPYKWIHQVRSHERNIAVNLWWDHDGTKRVNLDRCKDAKNDLMMTFGDIDWGHFDDDESFKSLITSMADDKTISLDQFRSLFFEDNFSGEIVFEGKDESLELEGEKHLQSIFSLLDSDKDGVISTIDVDSLSYSQWEEIEEMEETMSSWMNDVLSHEGDDEL